MPPPRRRFENAIRDDPRRCPADLWGPRRVSGDWGGKDRRQRHPRDDVVANAENAAQRCTAIARHPLPRRYQ